MCGGRSEGGCGALPASRACAATSPQLSPAAPIDWSCGRVGRRLDAAAPGRNRASRLRPRPVSRWRESAGQRPTFPAGRHRCRDTVRPPACPSRPGSRPQDGQSGGGGEPSSHLQGEPSSHLQKAHVDTIGRQAHRHACDQPERPVAFRASAAGSHFKLTNWRPGTPKAPGRRGAPLGGAAQAAVQAINPSRDVVVPPAWSAAGRVDRPGKHGVGLQQSIERLPGHTQAGAYFGNSQKRHNGHDDGLHVLRGDVIGGVSGCRLRNVVPCLYPGVGLCVKRCAQCPPCLRSGIAPIAP